MIFAEGPEYHSFPWQWRLWVAGILSLFKISRRVAKKTCIDQAIAKKRLYQRASLCLQRLNASSILARQPTFAPTYVDGD